MSGVCVLHEGYGRPCVWCVWGVFVCVCGQARTWHTLCCVRWRHVCRQKWWASGHVTHTHSTHTGAGQSTTSAPSHPHARAHHMGCAIPSTPAAVSNAASVPPKPLNSR